MHAAAGFAGHAYAMVHYLVMRRCGEVIPKQIVTVRLQHGLVPHFHRDFRLQTGA